MAICHHMEVQIVATIGLESGGRNGRVGQKKVEGDVSSSGSWAKKIPLATIISILISVSVVVFHIFFNIDHLCFIKCANVFIRVRSHLRDSSIFARK